MPEPSSWRDDAEIRALSNDFDHRLLVYKNKSPALKIRILPGLETALLQLSEKVHRKNIKDWHDNQRLLNFFLYFQSERSSLGMDRNEDIEKVIDNLMPSRERQNQQSQPDQSFFDLIQSLVRENDAKTWEQMGDFVNQNGLNLAVWSYLEALKLDPNNIHCLAKLGDTYFTQECYKKALETYYAIKSRQENYPNIDFKISLAKTQCERIQRYACEKGDRDLVGEFLDLGVVDTTLLHIAVKKNDMNMVQFLLQKNYQVSFKDEFGWTACHYAPYKGFLDLTKLICTDPRFAEVKNVKTRAAETLLHVAIKNNKDNVSEYLIQGNLFLTEQDNDGWTALHWAAYKIKPDLVRLILQKSRGSNLRQIRDRKGRTALDVSKENENSLTTWVTTWFAANGDPKHVTEILSSD